MSKFVLCKATEKGKQSFFFEMEGKRYYLFKQDYRVSNKDYFANGVNLNDAVNISRTHSEATRNTMTKIRKALTALEKELGLAIWNKTIRAKDRKGKRSTRAARINQAIMDIMEVS